MPEEQNKSVCLIDIEVGFEDKKIHDMGALNGMCEFHKNDKDEFLRFISGAAFLCGHNIIHHDLRYLCGYNAAEADLKKILPLYAKEQFEAFGFIDTLYLSPLLFPKRPYHSLVKNDKLSTDDLNNPLNDCKKAKELFDSEEAKFASLTPEIRQILFGLLHDKLEFKGFFEYLSCKYKFEPLSENALCALITAEFKRKLCQNSNILAFIKSSPIELAYALALISADDRFSITPKWLLKNYPEINNVILTLCNKPCRDKACFYCQEKLDIYKNLKQIFGFDSFRPQGGEPLQENAIQAAVDGKSLLAVFPTGGGKSITFQLPAIMAGNAAHGLTVVISPLQSLMKDQVDNLREKQHIYDAVTVNGLLNSVELANSYEQVENGNASLLYISPEKLRSKTTEKLLLGRNVVRFVIDEAHCFSAWGHDFRVDYLYIGDFIKELQQKKLSKTPIQVSCFTATAKQKVISDISDYFYKKLGLNLKLYTTQAARENLRYRVLHCETAEDKYKKIRELIEEKNCPAIIYVARTKRTRELAERLCGDGIDALPFNGKMPPADKIKNQEAFISGEVKTIVATSAFGMGVDKKDIGLVIHYDISDSLENYIQEAGRAGRNPKLYADCYVLFSDNDLDKHFIMLNQTKLSMSEIQQVWQAIKALTKHRNKICCSALEIARQAGWENSVYDIETRIKTAVATLESAGYVKRGQNMPRIYATSILAKNMAEAAEKIDNSELLNEKEGEKAKQIIKSLISKKNTLIEHYSDAESQIDYLADMHGLKIDETINLIRIMRQIGILKDAKDMSAYIFKGDTQRKSQNILDKFAKLEGFLYTEFSENECTLNIKELNGKAIYNNIEGASAKDIRTLFYYMSIKNLIDKSEHAYSPYIRVVPKLGLEKLKSRFDKRIKICSFIVKKLFEQNNTADLKAQEAPVVFSLLGLLEMYNTNTVYGRAENAKPQEVENALLYLSKIGAMRLEGDFFVIYNRMSINRLIETKIRYKLKDYELLNEFYKQKIRQIHIVGEYANLMVKDYEGALQFVQDYFQMNFKEFINKYFKGEKASIIEKNITPKTFHKIFDGLSSTQTEIINSKAKYIAVAAGPGSGKTMVLVRKLASLFYLEEVKHEQLLMLTFSRAAATEFKKRLIELVGNAANRVQIKTFHSFCFDLLDRVGSLNEADNVVKKALQMIEADEVEQCKICKTVLVIDEAQDMQQDEYKLVQALMKKNEDMRVIAVGDDDQNIYAFRGSSSEHFKNFARGAVRFEMSQNYRSKANIVALANAFIKPLKGRMKTKDIIAADSSNGVVQLIWHKSEYLEEAIVNRLEAQLANSNFNETTCILTRSNQEALSVLAFLRKKGINAKLMQTLDAKFSLYDLCELRFFLNAVGAGPIISDEQWKKAKKELISLYNTSTCLKNCLNLLKEFDETAGTRPKDEIHNKLDASEIENEETVRYKSDLEQFIRESKYEDFYAEATKTVFVSTLHQAKGREFDNVYMLLKNRSADESDERRLFYVGITRAKQKLFIHCNNKLFADFHIANVEKINDPNLYKAPDSIILQLSYKDVYLSYFKHFQNVIKNLRSGQALKLRGKAINVSNGLQASTIGRLSNKFEAKLNDYKRRGFEPYKAEIRFIAKWKDDEEEIDIVLPDIYLRRKPATQPPLW